MKHTKSRYSFRSVLSVATLVCWILPIAIICMLASSLLNWNYNENLRNATQERVVHAMTQLELRLDSAIEDSRSVSYASVIQQAAHNQPDSLDAAEVKTYMQNKFSRSALYPAAFLEFLEPGQEPAFYASGDEAAQAKVLQQFQDEVLPSCREALEGGDTDVVIFCAGDRLYLLRYLLDDASSPFAILAMELDRTELMQSIEPLALEQNLVVTIDDVSFPFTTANEIVPDPARTADLSYALELEGHTLTFSGQVIGLNLWTTVPKLRWIVASACVLVLPMLTIIIVLFLRNINHPISVLMEASRRLRNNERGYQIGENPPNSEFALLYQDFNAMSQEMKNQFEQLYQEQQALQVAKIKALQSQINPHFLNNTLEVINWEARMQGNEQVSSMIEALSTMLDAAIGRDGRSFTCLCQEMKYVEAYLYITQVRLGDRLQVVRQIDSDTMKCTVPLLILQPVLENAVEYDLSHTGGELCLRAFLRDGLLHLEAEHTGKITEAGWETLRMSLDRSAAAGAATSGRSVGVRNIVNRLMLIYGDEAQFDIRQVAPDRILAEMILPPRPSKYNQI